MYTERAARTPDNSKALLRYDQQQSPDARFGCIHVLRSPRRIDDRCAQLRSCVDQLHSQSLGRRPPFATAASISRGSGSKTDTARTLAQCEYSRQRTRDGRVDASRRRSSRGCRGRRSDYVLADCGERRPKNNANTAQEQASTTSQISS